MSSRLGPQIKHSAIAVRSDRGSVNKVLRNIATASMAPLTQWDRLIRYVSAKDGKVYYGEPIADANADIDQLATDGALKVKVLEGTDAFDAVPTGAEDEVKELLGPLASKDVPTVRCTGLNYKNHSKDSFFYTDMRVISDST